MRTMIATVGLLFLGAQFGVAPAVAQGLAGTGTLSGTVDAEVDFQAAQVYAHLPGMQVTYMVYTHGGDYEAVNLRPGTYDVWVEHPDLSSESRQVVIESGRQATADFTLSRADASGSAIIGSLFGGMPDDIELVAYDEMFPAGDGRDTLERTCMTCHGRNFIPLRSGLDEDGWRALIDLMLSLDDTFWGDRGDGSEEPIPFLTGDLVPTAEEVDQLVAYLGRHFGPGTSQRMLLNDEQVALDEEALGKAMWIEYTAPDVSPDGGPDGRFQEQFFDLDGNVWLTEGVGNTGGLVRLDPRTATWTRFPYMADRFGHGVVTDPMESETVLWIAGRGYDVARLDAQTGEYTWYGDTSTTRRWGGHTPAFDSNGVLWYTGIQEDLLGRWDRESGQLKRWKIPTRGGRPYGIVVDHQDHVWFGNLHTCTVTSFNQTTEDFTEYVAPSAPCALRRPGLDSMGNIWYGAFSAGTLGKIDPTTGDIVEYQIGRFAEPYEAYVDPGRQGLGQ